MTPHWADESVTVFHGDCIEVMAELDDNSVDAVVTDPPYGLEFMGRTWDRFDGENIDPAFMHWFAGFVDGEGCFSVHKKPHPSYDCQFSITLRADDRPILERIHRTLRMGTLSKPTAHTGGTDNPKARFSVSSQRDCVRLRDLLRAFPLRAKKALDFEIWSDALDAWLTHERGQWDDMALLRDELMQGRAYKDEGVRVDPFQMWCWRWSRECLRVLKPGGHMLAFGGTRTWHRLACAVEDAGFEVRDSIAWLYGSGFPKSLDVSKAIDKAAGVERADVYEDRPRVMDNDVLGRGLGVGVVERRPATPDAARWQGWGTGLKPAHEPIVVARKPLAGTVTANVLEHGTGALNIDACRIDASEGRPLIVSKSEPSTGILGDGLNGSSHGGVTTAGRWPANVVLDETAAEELDQQSGTLTSGKPGNSVRGERSDASVSYGDMAAGSKLTGFGDSGGASRFFYVPKAGTDERPRHGQTAHPTVKPLDLMRWLVRLVTPPDGIVLDPFAGSGTTAEACIIEGFRCVTIEREPDYLPLITQRLTKPIEPVMF